MIMDELKWDICGPRARNIDIPGIDSHNCTGLTTHKQAVRIPYIFRLTVYCRVKISQVDTSRKVTFDGQTDTSPCCFSRQILYEVSREDVPWMIEDVAG
jgi:hypothetical protein